MNKKDFNLLVESVKEMNKIRAGKAKAAKVTKMNAIHIKEIRQKLDQSQAEFAYMIGVSPSTLRNWEQGLRQPVGPAQALLRIAESRPEVVLDVLHSINN